MNLRANSLILAVLNIAVLGLAYLTSLLRMESSTVGGVIAFLPMVTSPVLLLATVVYLPRDLMRRDTRWGALLALVLSVPCVIYVLSVSLDF